VSSSSEVFEALKDCGVDLVTSVPCVNLRDLLLMIRDDPGMRHIPVTREEEGVGICAGAYLGGMRPVLLMQNSGLGNSINALASLDLLYGIPLLMVISHRGLEGEQIVGQVPMGQLTEPLLEAMGIPAHVLDRGGDAGAVIERAWDGSLRERRPAAVLIKQSYWGRA
jgi:sulfopyruvate decarboxylase subunit alpha